MVLQELELLDEDSNIFKLIGPILVKQDPLEATTNVKKRLDFIQGEVDRLDAQLKRLDDKLVFFSGCQSVPARQCCW